MSSQKPEVEEFHTIEVNGKPGKCIFVSPYHIVPISSQHGSFCLSTEAARVDFANAISTTKYTWYSWLPKSIWEQFRRIANIYFLLISVLMVSSTTFETLALPTTSNCTVVARSLSEPTRPMCSCRH